MARAERERLQRRWILTAVISTIVIVIGVIGYGFYDSMVVQPRLRIASVNGDEITKAQFRGRMRIIQRELAAQLNQYIQMESFFGSDPSVLQSLRSVEAQIETQLANPEVLGRDVLDTMIVEAIIRQEADAREISVTEEEVAEDIELSFNYFANGTPTPLPSTTLASTATVDPTAAAGTTPTSTSTLAPTPAESPTPFPTATPYTRELFDQDYRSFLSSLSDWDVREADYLAFVTARLLREKLRADFDPEIEREQEHVQLQHIVVEDEATADEVRQLLDEGSSWEELAAEYSVDLATANTSGDLGWMALGEIVRSFGQAGLAAFVSEDGSITPPLETSDGWQLFRVVAHQQRPLSDEAFQIAADEAFDTWLTQLKDEAEVEIVEDLAAHVINTPGYGF
jgi:parvulin-like peptidyl-prolyl isomerase